MPVIQQDWLNQNELRRYPLHDAATAMAANGVALPDDIIVDANIWIPRTAGKFVFVSSVSVTPGIITVTFAATDATPFGGSPSSAFVPVGVVSVVRPAIRFKNYPMTPFIQGAGGWIALGQGATAATEKLFVSLANAAAGLLVDRCVRAYYPAPVTSLGKYGSSQPLQGLVSLAGIQGSVVTRGAVMNVGGAVRPVGLIGLDLSKNGVTTLQDFAGSCGHRPQASNCNNPPIESINNVKPDCYGNIDIKFSGLAVVGGLDDGMVLDSALGLTEACGPSPFAQLPYETANPCALEIVMQPADETAYEGKTATFRIGVSAPGTIHYNWSMSFDGHLWVGVVGGATYTTPVLTERYNNAQYQVEVFYDGQPITEPVQVSRIAKLTVIPVSSTIPHPYPSSSLVPGGEYCEHFYPGSPTELRTVHGIFAQSQVVYSLPKLVYGYRLVSSPTYPHDEQLTLNHVRTMDVNAGFVISGTIRPKNNGEGHLIFGYAGPTNFFMFGVVVQHTNYPYGAFFIAQRQAVAGTGTLGTGTPGSEYVFLPGGVFDLPSADALTEADYYLTAHVYKIGSFVLVDWLVTWEDLSGNIYSRSGSYPISTVSFWSAANDDAQIGLGVYDSQTEFADFGINCPASSATNNCGSWNFAAGMGPFAPMVGSFGLLGGKLTAGPAPSPSGFLALQSQCLVDLYAPLSHYSVSAVLKPGDQPNAEAGVAFSVDLPSVTATPPGNMWVAGVSLAPTDATTNGTFFIDQRCYEGASTLRIPLPSTVKLYNVEYTVAVTVTRVADQDPTDAGRRVQIAAHISWIDPGPPANPMSADVSTTTLLNETTSGDVAGSILRATLVGLWAAQLDSQFESLSV